MKFINHAINQNLIHMNIALRKQRLAVTILLSVFLFASQTLLAYEENRDLKNFSKIGFSISGDLYLTQGSEYSIKIEGAQKDVEKIITKLEDQTLIIKVKNDWKNYGDIKVYVTLPELSAVDLAGSGNVIAKSAFNVESIDLSVAGSGDINFDKLTTKEVEISVAGSGDVMLAGSAGEDLEISIAGSGDIEVSDLPAESVEVSISGSGTAKVHATKNLETNIVGSGSVYYKGNPMVDANSIGSGRTKSMK